MQASVIISYYKTIPNLELILMAFNKQTAKGEFEVIISEDADTVETVQFLNVIRPTLAFPVQHISQEDKGFRKCKALNKAIQFVSTDFIIFIDGDCIPHRKFIEEYLKEKKEGRVLFGRRVMLSEKLTKQLLITKKLKKINLFNLLITRCERVEEGFYLPSVTKYLKEKNEGILLGCNMGIFKKDIVAINGFDEDYESAGGGEDTDIEWRLQAMGGITFYSMKFKAIVYHLYHIVRFSKGDVMPNQYVVDNKKREGFFICKNGLKKIQ